MCNNRLGPGVGGFFAKGAEESRAAEGGDKRPFCRCPKTTREKQFFWFGREDVLFSHVRTNPTHARFNIGKDWAPFCVPMVTGGREGKNGVSSDLREKKTEGLPAAKKRCAYRRGKFKRERLSPSRLIPGDRVSHAFDLPAFSRTRKRGGAFEEMRGAARTTFGREKLEMCCRPPSGFRRKRKCRSWLGGGKDYPSLLLPERSLKKPIKC